MNKRILLALGIAMTTAPIITAQRVTDALGRGLVAIKTDNGVFCSWRINADEWDCTEYNIYRGTTKLNSSPLKVSNFSDLSGSSDATYTVCPVINGVEAEACAPVKVWEKNYTIIKPQHAPEIKTGLVPNDATAADVDGDGELEIIMKYDNSASSYHDGDDGIFTVVECLEMDGSVKWWINFGPNIGDFQNNEINIIATDWDGDGKAEVVFRAADGTILHMADGSTYTVGDSSINYRGNDWPSGQWFMHWGKEYLIYANGETCKPYECIDYPLVRVEPENNPNGLLSGASYDSLVNQEWGDGYGHRSSKYFFGAPYLDGRKPSLFLARGIYTKHKMIAYDIDADTHKLIERWRWNDLGGAWYGQGYHNFGIADVDWDGRDEIVYGSMVIDDNGYGLSTTGLGHGDAQHCGDFDPYSHGQEIFACNEDNPNNNFRDATTSKIYYRTTGGNDDGRSMMGNFVDEYPGAEGISSKDDALIGGASHKAIVGDTKSSVSITQNFRVFWDGDLCDESFDYNNGKNSQGAIYKPRQGRIALLDGSKTNNDTKGTPCFQGDILGDWREEYIMRDADNNIRIFSTDIPTEHRIYSLWYDHQYRNAMNWQMCGYNQPPHVSFALSSFENITDPPAPLTMTGRYEVANNGTIGASLNGKHVIVCETGDMTLSAQNGSTPAILTVNTPTWVEGHNNNNNITTKTYTHIITAGSFGGDMRLIKQGDGVLVMPDGTHTYSGKTEIWAGTIVLNDGVVAASPIWINRFGILKTKKLNAPAGIDMEYAAILKLGDDSTPGELTTGSLTLGFGSILELDAFADKSIDKINAAKLTIEKKDWSNGPEYLQPIIKFSAHPADNTTSLPSGKYLIGEIGEIDGDINDIILLGLEDLKKTLIYEDGKLYASLSAYQPGIKTWIGDETAMWDLDNSKTFKNNETGSEDVFVPGDEVIFDDNALSTNVVIEGRLQPESVTFSNNEKDYTLSGDGQIVGEGKLVKEGSGSLTVNNINSYTGGTYINGGKLVAGVFANKIGNDLGALSDVSTKIIISNNATLAVNASGTLGQRITMQNGNAALEIPDGLTLTTSTGITATGVGQKLYKRGKGTLNLAGGNTMHRLVIEEGIVNASEVNDVISLPPTVEFVKGALWDPESMYTYSKNPTNYHVEDGNSGSLYLDSRCSYSGKLTGKGTLYVYAAGVRCDLTGNWAEFEGEIIAGYHKRGAYDPDFKWDNNYGMPKATLSISSGVTFNAQSHNIALGNLKGSGIYNGTGNLTIGNDEKNISFSGTFAGKPKVVKIGKCDMILSKLLSEINGLTVKEGTLSLNATKTPYNTVFLKAPLTIEGDAKLRGRGTVANITVNEHGIIQPGSYSETTAHHYGPLFSTGNVTVNEGATLSLYLRMAGKNNDCSYLDVKGNLKIDGNVKVTMNPEYAPAVGDEFRLWITENFSGTPNIELPELPEGLAWDFQGLKDATGMLKVVESTSVSMIGESTPVTCKVYDALGIGIGCLKTTMGNAKEDAKRNLHLSSGLYILVITAEGTTETLKLQF